MTIHRTRRLGDPILRERCQGIANPRSPAVRVVADDLRQNVAAWVTLAWFLAESKDDFGPAAGSKE